MNIRNLYFVSTRGEYRLIYENLREEEVPKAIQGVLDKYNFKSYYTRVWEVPEGTMYDVGSHTEFFLWGYKE